MSAFSYSQFPTVGAFGMPPYLGGMQPAAMLSLPAPGSGALDANGQQMGIGNTPPAFGIGMFPLSLPGNGFGMPSTIGNSMLSPFGGMPSPFQASLPSTFGSMPSFFPTTMTPSASSAGGNAQGNPLRQSLNLIESDPEGARLIQAARARGVYIEVGDPAQSMGSLDLGAACACSLCQAQQAADGGTRLLGVTTTNSAGQSKIVVNDASNIKTIVHELVHAVSPQDQNSRDEEGIAEVLGTRIAARIGAGVPQNEQQVFLNKQQFYPTLTQTNGIRQTLAGLGLNVTV